MAKAHVDETVERQSSEDLTFDDNGLENASQQAFWKEIFSIDRRIENAEKDPQLSSCDAFLLKRCEAQPTEIVTDQANSYLKEHLEDERGANSFGERRRASGTIYDEDDNPIDQNKSIKEQDQHGNLDNIVYRKFKKAGAENVDCKSSVKLKEVKAKDINFWSEYSANEGGNFESSIGLKIQDTAENVDSRGTIQAGEVKAKKIQVWSGCFVKGNTKLESLSSLAIFWVTSFSAISLKCSMSVTVGILLLMPSVGVEGAFTSVPANTLYVVGHTARMNCSTNLSRPVFWARSPVGSKAQQWLYYGKNGFNGNNADGRFTIDKDETTGRYDVIIEDVQPKDSGHYVCVDDSGIGVKASAELVVSDPMRCKSRIPTDGVMGYNVFGLEQDVIQISCSLNYTGNVSPTLKWNWHGSEVESDEPLVSLTTSFVISTLNLSPTKERNNAKFQCRANVEGATQNKVDDGLYWESETIGIKYAEFASEEVDTCPGVQWNLLCNPPCSYHFESKGGDCQCLYTYYDARTQQKYNITSDAVSCGKDKDMPLSTPILIAVAAVCTISIAAVIGMVCLLVRKKTKGRPADGSEGSDHTNNDDDSSKSMLPDKV